MAYSPQQIKRLSSKKFAKRVAQSDPKSSFGKGLRRTLRNFRKSKAGGGSGG